MINKILAGLDLDCSSGILRAGSNYSSPRYYDSFKVVFCGVYQHTTFLFFLGVTVAIFFARQHFVSLYQQFLSVEGRFK